MHMRHRNVLLAALFATAVVSGACSSTPNRVYDPYYNDGHPWTRDEDRFYRRWEDQTHRQHVEINRRTAEEQHAYFDWRHNRSGDAR